MRSFDKFSLIREVQVLEIENEMLRDKVKKLQYEIKLLGNPNNTEKNKENDTTSKSEGNSNESL